MVAKAEWNSSYAVTELDSNDTWRGRIRVYGNFLGRTNLRVRAQRGSQEVPVDGILPVTVLRPERVIDRVFVSSVALFVSLIFINFGCAMDWPTVKGVLKRPIGPIIGMAGQYIFMPLMSFGTGFLIFPNNPAMRLGMFFTGVSPSGGASNIWTFILKGNLNLSLAMTSVSTLASFGFMPLWLFSLGQVVFANANIVVPYSRIATFVVGLIVPLAIGLGMQKWTPKLAGFMVRILKGFSTTLLLFIIVFAIVTNLYIFELFTWEIIVAGMVIPWLGYMFGYAFARLLKQPHPDALAISIETGLQNTGIAIFLLRYALPQPEADLTTVVPVSVAIMTPIPMTCIYIYQKIRDCFEASQTETLTKKSLKKTAYPACQTSPASRPLISSPTHSPTQTPSPSPTSSIV
ncbi:sodium bile acid symporter family domain-containing protein [Phthorimaea operculella]|nr:sodium bile acid symporter family domain-containing protein [Phthorimaea operculella]